VWSTVHPAADRASFDPVYDALIEPTRKIEAWLELQQQVEGWCDCCGKVVPLRIDAGPRFAHHPSLRAGMVCPRGTNARARLLLRMVRSLGLEQGRCALFEAHSPLASALKELTPLEMHLSEYVDGGVPSGETIMIANRPVTQQDMTATSYPDKFFDVVVHNDVLEHIPWHHAALRESGRILKPGGVLMFTVPFFIQLDQSVQLASLGPDGRVRQHIEPPEFHGDPIRGSVLTFWHFGWDLLTSLRDAGFDIVELRMSFDPFSGIMSDNHPAIRAGNNPPNVIFGRKARS
jgi:SAM-dependent methyltransferase